MDVQGKTSPLVFQALSYFGKEEVTQGMISRLRSLLTARDKAELKANLHHAPAWLQTVLKHVVAQGKD
jgi:hypothetical protein